jgi:hypothetical protein
MISNYFESSINFDPRDVDYSDLLHSKRYDYFQNMQDYFIGKKYIILVFLGRHPLHKLASPTWPYALPKNFP